MDGFVEPVRSIRSIRALTLTLSPSCIVVNFNFFFSSLLFSSLSDLKVRVGKKERKKASKGIPDIK